ncbi:MAG: hypothetical protein ACE5I3_03660 [Phycisphaerae bacterium]
MRYRVDDMVQTRWLEAQNHYESLAVSLRTLLACWDMDRQYDELVAVLGLGAATVVASDDSLGWWCTYARDASLIETAELYGLGLRELHPPEATQGLSRSAEFAQHFRDSYVPLIARALEHGQPVLAWRGWPAPRERLWGVITSIQGELIFGHTLWHDGQPLPLTGPAHQVYVVEEFRPPEHDAVTPADLFAHVARQARAVWAGRWARCPNVQTGAAAYRAWQDALRDPSGRGSAALPLCRQQSQAARVHVAARSYLATWLRRVAGGLAGDHIELAAHWANACDRAGNRLLPYESAEVVKELLGQPGGVERVCRAIDDVAKIEANLVKKLETMQ